MLKQHKGQWALMSKSSPGKVLQYFGKTKPSAKTVQKAEARVQFYKHGGALSGHTK